MKLLLDIGLMLKRRILEELRDPMWLFMGMTTPLLYLALFAPLLSGSAYIGGGSVVNYFMPGMLALFAFSTGTGVGWVIIDELKAGIVERFRVTPVSRFALLMGSVLKDMLAFLVPALLVTAVAAIFGFSIHIGGLLLLFLLLMMLTAMISAVCHSLGLILKVVGTLAAVITGMTLPITLLAGVLLPISAGPAWLRVLAHVNPLYYIVEASRYLGAGTVLDWHVGLAFAVTVPLLALALWWATTVMKKAVS